MKGFNCGVQLALSKEIHFMPTENIIFHSFVTDDIAAVI